MAGVRAGRRRPSNTHLLPHKHSMQHAPFPYQEVFRSPPSPLPGPPPLSYPPTHTSTTHLVQEADLPLGGVQVDLHMAWRQLQVQEQPGLGGLVGSGAGSGCGSE